MTDLHTIKSNLLKLHITVARPVQILHNMVQFSLNHPNYHSDWYRVCNQIYLDYEHE